MFVSHNTVTILDLDNNTSSEITLYDLADICKTRKDAIMIKDRYGWTHIKEINTLSAESGGYSIAVTDETIDPIIIGKTDTIPIFTGNYREGFHGTAIYEYKEFPVSYLEFHHSAVDNGSVKDNTPKLLFCAKNQLFYEFNVQILSDICRTFVNVVTNSGLCDINGITMITNQ